MADTKRELRGIRLTGAVSSTEVRLGTLLGVEHVIAPIVLLVGDSVIFPINAEHPEFVPAEVLSIAPAGWCGRPAMAGDHPAEDGAMVSANIPVILEGHQFGQLFNVRFKDNRLQGEVWLNPARAAEVPDGLEIVQRIRGGDPVEISVGAFVVVEHLAGQSNGRDYGSIWREITPDHVALLREGLIGACSLDMGCGTPRTAVHHTLEGAQMRAMSEAEVTELTAHVQARAELRAASRQRSMSEHGHDYPHVGDRVKIVGSPHMDGHDEGIVRQVVDGALGIEFDGMPNEVHHWYVASEVMVTERATAVDPEEAEAEMEDMTAATRSKLITFLGSEAALTAAQGMSDTELRDLLYEALKRIDPACVFIQAVYTDDKAVVYLIDPDPGGPLPLKPYQRSYTLGENGTSVTFAEERIPVRRREEWVPVSGYRSAEETAAAAAAAERGGCGCGGNHSAQQGAGGATMAANAERITALITNPRSPFEEADRAYLETLSVERITAAEAKAAEPTAGETAAGAADADTVTVSADELASLRAMAADRERTRTAQKRALVSKLKTAQTTYNEARLSAMELEQLQDTAALLQLDAPVSTDYVALEREIDPPTVVEPPKPWSMALAKRNGAAS